MPRRLPDPTTEDLLATIERACSTYTLALMGDAYFLFLGFHDGSYFSLIRATRQGVLTAGATLALAHTGEGTP